MFDALAELVTAFPGAANRTQCFTHILNLVVKVILCQFDMPKAKGDNALDVASQALLDLAGDIEMENEAMDKNMKEQEDDDRREGSVDLHEGMSQEEQDELDVTVHPVQLVLVKLSLNSDLGSRTYTKIKLQKLTYTIKNFSTILLSHWIQILEDLKNEAELSKSIPLAI